MQSAIESNKKIIQAAIEANKQEMRANKQDSDEKIT